VAQSCISSGLQTRSDKRTRMRSMRIESEPVGATRMLLEANALFAAALRAAPRGAVVLSQVKEVRTWSAAMLALSALLDARGDVVLAADVSVGDPLRSGVH
jgi:hypothetical protein